MIKLSTCVIIEPICLWAMTGTEFGLRNIHCLFTITKYSITVQKHLKKRHKKKIIQHIEWKKSPISTSWKIYGATLSCELYIFIHENRKHLSTKIGKWKYLRPTRIKIFRIMWFKSLHKLVVELAVTHYVLRILIANRINNGPFKIFNRKSQEN